MALQFYAEEIPPIKRTVTSNPSNGNKPWKYWMDYWAEQHQLSLGILPRITRADNQKYKRMVEFSVEKRGEEHFKKMIDWLINNHSSYPQFSPVCLEMVCGDTPTANKIAALAIGQTSFEDVAGPNW